MAFYLEIPASCGNFYALFPQNRLLNAKNQKNLDFSSFFGIFFLSTLDKTLSILYNKIT